MVVPHLASAWFVLSTLAEKYVKNNLLSSEGKKEQLAHLEM